MTAAFDEAFDFTAFDLDVTGANVSLSDAEVTVCTLTDACVTTCTSADVLITAEDASDALLAGT